MRILPRCQQGKAGSRAVAVVPFRFGRRFGLLQVFL